MGVDDVADGAVAPGAGYRAFLSYSHRDEAVAARLHRKLESYRLPKALIGSDGVRGVVPARLSPIFRDREELSAGESLSDRIRDALSVSDALIVLCSPAAKSSHWVAQEIRLFRELHPDRPVYAALIEGEPDEAFPAPLVEGGAEPIAPDFRKGKDGASLALIKLIAGVSGVPLDALIQRDAQRQRRRVMAITLGSLAAVLIMALMLAFAIRAQREAERQRAEAEGLVEYMLTDLRDRLKGVGRLDVMTAVNERAMRYYGNDSLKAQILKAKALHALGEDLSKREDTEKARRTFLAAAKVSGDLLAKNPTDADVLLTHAKSEFWLGLSDVIEDQPLQAQSHLLSRKNLADRAIQFGGAKPEYLSELAEADGDLCANGLDLDPSGTHSLSYCLSSLAAAEKAMKLQPISREARILVANRHAWLADVYRAIGRRKLAYASRVLQKNILLSLKKENPNDARIMEFFAFYYDSMARYCIEDKDIPNYRNNKRNAQIFYEKILKIEPSNFEIKKRLDNIESI